MQFFMFFVGKDHTAEYSSLCFVEHDVKWYKKEIYSMIYIKYIIRMHIYYKIK